MNNKKKIFWIALAISLVLVGPGIALLSEIDVITNRVCFLIFTIYTGVFTAWIWGTNFMRLLSKKPMEDVFNGLCFLALFLMLLIFTIATWEKL